jgi:hypothetical protein
MSVKTTPRHKRDLPTYTFRKNCKSSWNVVPFSSLPICYLRNVNRCTRYQLDLNLFVATYIRCRLDRLLCVYLFCFSVTSKSCFMSTLCLICEGCRQLWDLMLFRHFQLSVSEYDSRTFQINCSYFGR